MICKMLSVNYALILCALDECRIMLQPRLIEMKFEVLSVVSPYLLRKPHKLDQ